MILEKFPPSTGILILISSRYSEVKGIVLYYSVQHKTIQSVLLSLQDNVHNDYSYIILRGESVVTDAKCRIG